jgi:hypothetical protein
VEQFPARERAKPRHRQVGSLPQDRCLHLGDQLGFGLARRPAELLRERSCTRPVELAVSQRGPGRRQSLHERERDLGQRRGLRAGTVQDQHQLVGEELADAGQPVLVLVGCPLRCGGAGRAPRAVAAVGAIAGQRGDDLDLVGGQLSLDPGDALQLERLLFRRPLGDRHQLAQPERGTVHAERRYLDRQGQRDDRKRRHRDPVATTLEHMSEATASVRQSPQVSSFQEAGIPTTGPSQPGRRTSSQSGSPGADG